jgi:RimJ/RimL family protein N-acetyltransferase
LAKVEKDGNEIIVGVGQAIKDNRNMAEVAFAVTDAYQNQGIGTELLAYLTTLAKNDGLLGFSAEVLLQNRPMLHVFEKMGFQTQKMVDGGVYDLVVRF